MLKRVVFVGTPNVGKSTLINQMCNEMLSVGNWAGVTSDYSLAYYTEQSCKVECVDLPGVYGLSKYTHDDLVTVNYFENHEVDCIVNVIDATCLLNNLNCTLMLRELQIPMVIVLNYESECLKKGIIINVRKLAYELGIPIISLECNENSRITDLKKIIHKQANAKVVYYPLYCDYLRQKFIFFCRVRQDSLKNKISSFNVLYKHQVRKDRQERITKFSKIITIESKDRFNMTHKIDHFLLYHRYSWLLAQLILVVFLMCSLQISQIILAFVQPFFNGFITKLEGLISGLPPMMIKFILQGVVGSAFSILSLLFMLFVVYLGLSLFEESGYMARCALLAKKSMRRLNLPGRSMIAFILGFGCNVAALVSIEGIKDIKVKKRLALIIPFLSCSARLPIYLFLIHLVFPQHAYPIILILYLMNILLVVIFSLVLGSGSKIVEEIFVELPPYRMPKLKVLLIKVYKQCKLFIIKSFKSVYWVIVALWVLLHFPSGDIMNSVLLQIINHIQWIFKPLGFGEHWFFVVALLPAVIAKESVVAFFLVLPQDYFIDVSTIQAFSFMVYCLCSTPCIMTLFMIAKKYGRVHAIKSFLLMNVSAYLLCFIIYQTLYRLHY